jgi:hypothetical protein
MIRAPVFVTLLAGLNVDKITFLQQFNVMLFISGARPHYVAVTIVFPAFILE